MNLWLSFFGTKIKKSMSYVYIWKTLYMIISKKRDSEKEVIIRSIHYYTIFSLHAYSSRSANVLHRSSCHINQVYGIVASIKYKYLGNLSLNGIVYFTERNTFLKISNCLCRTAHICKYKNI